MKVETKRRIYIQSVCIKSTNLVGRMKATKMNPVFSKSDSNIFRNVSSLPHKIHSKYLSLKDQFFLRETRMCQVRNWLKPSIKIIINVTICQSFRLFFELYSFSPHWITSVNFRSKSNIQIQFSLKQLSPDSDASLYRLLLIGCGFHMRHAFSSHC